MSHLPHQLLHRFADGEASPVERAEAEAMMRRDPAAAAEVDGVHAIGDRLRDAPLPRPSADAHNRWLAAWQIARDRGVRRVAGWMTAAAAVVLGVTLASAYRAEATPQPALAEWETAAVGSADDDENPRTARLIAVDLALPSPGATR